MRLLQEQNQSLSKEIKQLRSRLPDTSLSGGHDLWQPDQLNILGPNIMSTVVDAWLNGKCTAEQQKKKEWRSSGGLDVRKLHGKAESTLSRSTR